MPIKKVTLEQLNDYLKAVKLTRKIDRLIVHHFWRPKAAQYQGLATIESVRNYHVHTKGWSDIGYHIIVGPNGDIWLGRPISRSGAHTVGQNQRSVGLAYAADFDQEDPQQNGYEVGVKVTAAVCRRFGMEEDDVFFHRDFAPKSCPGDKMDRSRFRQEVLRAMEGSLTEDFVRLKIDDHLVLGAQIRIVDSKSMGLEGPLAEVLGVPAQNPDQLVVVRDYLKQHGVLIPAKGWHPEQGPAGTIYAYTEYDAPEEDHPEN